MTTAIGATRQRTSYTDPLTTDLVYEWLGQDPGVDNATVANLLAASLPEIEGICGQPIYPSEWLEIVDGLEQIPTAIDLPDVRLSPISPRVYYYAAGGARTEATLESFRWSASDFILRLTIAEVSNADTDRPIEIEWSDAGVSPTAAPDQARLISIAHKYDQDSGDMPSLTTMLQPYMRIY